MVHSRYSMLRGLCVAIACASLTLAVGIAFTVAAPGVFDFYPPMLRAILPAPDVAFTPMLALMTVAALTAALSFVLASPSARAARFRRFLTAMRDNDRRHCHPLALST